MKGIKYLLIGLVSFWGVITAQASGLGDVRVNARFLTDRMALELNLNRNQYDDLFEINYDFLNGINRYIPGLARRDPAAIDAYYYYLNERNDDLRWIMSGPIYARFMTIEHFYRPVYAVNDVCYLRVYKVYSNHGHFHYGRPVHYYTYCGAHSRPHCGGVSYYHKHYYGKRYHHAVYHGDYYCRPSHHHHHHGGHKHPHYSESHHAGHHHHIDHHHDGHHHHPSYPSVRPEPRVRRSNKEYSRSYDRGELMRSKIRPSRSDRSSTRRSTESSSRRNDLIKYTRNRISNDL